jgi:hypothetical protein
MAEVDKVMEEQVIETPETEEVDIELESDNEDLTTQEVVEDSQEFYKNLALDLSEDVSKKYF